MKFFYAFLILILSLVGVTGCSQQDQDPPKPILAAKAASEKHQYQFAVHPLHNPSRLFDVFNPLLEYLNQNIPEAEFTLEASRDYAVFDQKLIDQTVDFALPNPFQTLIAIEHNYRVIAKMGDDFNFKGIILVPKDSPIKTPKDLKGYSVSYPAPTALAGTILPQYYLQTHGLDINKDIKNVYVGSQESSIMSVYLGTTMAGATWPPPWEALSKERPELKEKLKVIWQTQSLPNNSVVAGKNVPVEISDKVQILLANLHTTAEGQKILNKMYLSKYEKADNSTYAPVKQFINQFQKTVRPLELHAHTENKTAKE
ncbi:hypothetical protein THMIRHAM_18840 [Thiomicrorhabdus immobilis]|uniref:Phosphonate ABC transporter substrate-binding protein n=1 Tax=Thiomicrorhabdus immobilis TaxID=2791037 RepID=A0ABN6D2B9_9GAMM|nr:phosphate/phosphite/phosphonate ABC transporter substrate-binding protein [Thiomicrorhabdus immobilis]BCN94099.1 hypothetical protein THMIRHAM_18840 [Thiomicrorhabdus immobilis]